MIDNSIVWRCLAILGGVLDVDSSCMVDLEHSCLALRSLVLNVGVGTLSLDCGFACGVNDSAYRRLVLGCSACDDACDLGGLFSGGVVLASDDGKIVCENTLDARLDVVFRQKLPEIRKQLFSKMAA
ncbi:hypothetical protein KY289_035981 [Solanum tuberosum]|nr:hypothetical protein KY289_035981 [Solanum tuberosum]